MTMGADNLGNGAATAQDRFGGPLNNYRSGVRREGEAVDGERPANLARLPGESELDRPVPPSLPLGGLTEPAFSPTNWLDGAGGQLADHPLLRGLLMELPPRGTMPNPDWLDRWFEAARAILELLYLQDAPRSH